MNKRLIKKRNKIITERKQFFDKHAIIPQLIGINIKMVEESIIYECNNKHYKNFKNLKKRYKRFPNGKLYIIDTKTSQDLRRLSNLIISKKEE